MPEESEYQPVSQKPLMQQSAGYQMIQTTQKIFVIRDQFSFDEFLQLSEERLAQMLILFDTSVMRNNPRTGDADDGHPKAGVWNHPRQAHGVQHTRQSECVRPHDAVQ